MKLALPDLRPLAASRLRLTYLTGTIWSVDLLAPVKSPFCDQIWLFCPMSKNIVSEIQCFIHTKINVCSLYVEAENDTNQIYVCDA